MYWHHCCFQNSPSSTNVSWMKPMQACVDQKCNVWTYVHLYVWTVCQKCTPKPFLLVIAVHNVHIRVWKQLIIFSRAHVWLILIHQDMSCLSWGAFSERADYFPPSMQAFDTQTSHSLMWKVYGLHIALKYMWCINSGARVAFELCMCLALRLISLKRRVKSEFGLSCRTQPSEE